MSITQRKLKEYIIYNKGTGSIIRNKDVRGVGNKGNEMQVYYSSGINKPYICIEGKKVTLLKALVLYVNGIWPNRCRFINDDITDFRYQNILYDPIDKIPTQEYVKKLFYYDPDSGVVYRRVASNGFKKGSVVGYKRSNSGVAVKLLGRTRCLHHIIWLYVYGYIPENQIDHINRDPLDNRLKNLREVSSQCNIRNQSVNSANTTGIKGVCPYKDSGQYFAYIYINYKNFHLGSFKDFDEAVCTRLAAEQCLDWAGCDSSSSAFQYVKNNINPYCK